MPYGSLLPSGINSTTLIELRSLAFVASSFTLRLSAARAILHCVALACSPIFAI